MEATGLWAYVRGLGSFWGFGIQGFKGCRASFLILDIRDIYIYVYVYIYIPYMDLEYVQFTDGGFSGNPWSKASAAHSCS